MRKKLFAVIMSAMMMITFMPTMAFAAWVDHVDAHNSARLANVTYSDNYEYAEADVLCNGMTAGGDNCNGYTYGHVSTKTDRIFSSADGSITVSCDAGLTAAANKLLTDIGATGVTLDSFTTSVQYYDLTGATIVGKDATQSADTYLDNTGWPKTASNPLGTKVKFVQPSYTFATGQTTALTATKDLTSSSDADGYFFYFKPATTALFRVDLTPGSYEAYEDSKDVEWGVEFSVYANQKVIGAGKSTQKVSVNADVVNFSHVLFAAKGMAVASGKLNASDYKASVATAVASPKTLSGTYVGEDQAFGTATKGITVEYGTYDKLNNLTWSATAPAMKDVKASSGTYNFLVKVNRKNVTKYVYVKFNVNAADFALRFKSNSFTFAAGEKVAMKDVVEGRIRLNEVSAGSKIYNTAAVYSADKKTAENFVNKYVNLGELRTTVGSSDMNLLKQSVVTTSTTDEEFKQFLTNYDVAGLKILTTGGEAVDKATATYNVVKGDNYFKTNKKSIKIKRGKSATLKDKARFGTITFKKISGNKKISVASNGKITVKKSLAKKTYKVKITERVIGTSQALSLKRTKTIKVIVK